MTDSIDSLAADYYQAWLAASPTQAHLLSEYRYAAKYEDGTRAAEDRRVVELDGFIGRASALPDAALDQQQRITRDVLVSDARNTIGMLEARLAEFAADPMFGPQAQLPLIVGMLSIPNSEVADAMVEKYRAIGQSFTDLAERQREGLARGRTSARFAVEGTIAQLKDDLAAPVGKDPLLGLGALPSGVDADGWRARMIEAVETSIRPGKAAYLEVLEDEVLARARPDDRAGLCWLEQGEENYDASLRFFTTTARTAEEIHQIGLEQVAKLADEYRGLGPEVVGTDDLQQIFAALRTDPKLHFENAAQLVEASEIAMKRAWATIPAWFEVLPKAPCEVESTTTGAKAFYFPPAPDGSRGGIFYINTTDPKAWGTFELESMAFHEGIPGHHLQIAIASELTDVPELRKHLFNAGYAEGWGLYSERLADEMELYGDSLDRMGMFSADSLRACRLVVDTGLHAMGWSRQQAVDYMVENSPMTEAICKPEVDRYLIRPGQATSYMIGRLEILRMRAEAKERQGSSFGIKKFHSAVLDSGSLPLSVLDEVVRARLA